MQLPNRLWRPIVRYNSGHYILNHALVLPVCLVLTVIVANFYINIGHFFAALDTTSPATDVAPLFNPACDLGWLDFPDCEAMFHLPGRALYPRLWSPKSHVQSAYRAALHCWGPGKQHQHPASHDRQANPGIDWTVFWPAYTMCRELLNQGDGTHPQAIYPRQVWEPPRFVDLDKSRVWKDHITLSSKTVRQIADRLPARRPAAAKCELRDQIIEAAPLLFTFAPLRTFATTPKTHAANASVAPPLDLEARLKLLEEPEPCTLARAWTPYEYLAGPWTWGTWTRPWPHFIHLIARTQERAKAKEQGTTQETTLSGTAIPDFARRRKLGAAVPHLPPPMVHDFWGDDAELKLANLGHWGETQVRCIVYLVTTSTWSVLSSPSDPLASFRSQPQEGEITLFTLFSLILRDYGIAGLPRDRELFRDIWMARRGLSEADRRKITKEGWLYLGAW